MACTRPVSHRPPLPLQTTPATLEIAVSRKGATRSRLNARTFSCLRTLCSGLPNEFLLRLSYHRSDKECPSHWEWHGSFNCCVPQTPSQSPEPSCPHGPWDRDQQCCHKPSNPSPPPPNPSHGHRHKREERTAPVAARNWRSKTVSCPAGQTICNVSDDLSKSNTWAWYVAPSQPRSGPFFHLRGSKVRLGSHGTDNHLMFNSVDIQKDANFCGGCGTPFDHGEDCAAIPNSWNVGCNIGKCTGTLIPALCVIHFADTIPYSPD
jgi:hypothetical protein